MNEHDYPFPWKGLGIPGKSHPWHGVPIGEHAPESLTAYIEMVPTDTLKLVLDIQSGHLRVDNFQRNFTLCPAPYGLIPQTYCGDSVAALSAERTNRTDLSGDQNPLDICVITEKIIPHGDILLQAIPIGGFRMIAGQKVDDKIVSVPKEDHLFGQWSDIKECPVSFIERLMQYFLSSNDKRTSENETCAITHVYGKQEAHDVIRRSQADYRAFISEMEYRQAPFPLSLN